jgi:TonB family protein
LSMRFLSGPVVVGASLCAAAVLSFFSLQDSAHPAAQTSPIRYENSIKGLKQMTQDALDAAKGSDQTKLRELTANMILPNSDDWFKVVFGEGIWTTYAQAYTRNRENLPAVLAGTFISLVQDGYKDFDPLRFSGNCDESVNNEEFDTLILREQLEPLSVIRFPGGGKTKTLRFFTYGYGTFKYVGGLASPTMPPPQSLKRIPENTPANGSIMIIQTDPDVQKSKLINQVLPRYPREALQNGIQGTVQIHAIISKEGKVSQMNLVSGPCILAVPAFRAVGQWRFTPTLLKDTPVEVECTFDVKFKIGK